MNRDRINQILTVLLFPFCDPTLGSYDPMLQKYLAYEQFLEYQAGSAGMLEGHEIQRKEYQSAEQKLQYYLEERNHGRIRSYDDILQLCELYYPLQNLRNEISRHKRKKRRTGYVGPREWIADYYYQNLWKIADSLITYRDGITSLRTWNNITTPNKKDIFNTPHAFDKLEIWNLLCRFTVPDIYIVIFAIHTNADIEVLYEQRPSISLADKLLATTLQKGLAENHLHFSAGHDYAAAWLYQVNPFQWIEKIKSRKKLDNTEDIHKIQATIFRILSALFLDEVPLSSRCTFMDWLTQKNYLYSDEIYQLLNDMDHGQTNAVTNLDLMMEDIVRNITSDRNEMDYDYLLETIYGKYIELKTSSEFILLYHCCLYQRRHRPRDYVFLHLFVQYLRIKNSLFQKTQQTNGIRGLRHFQDYFRASKEMLHKDIRESDAMLEVLRSQSKITSLKKIEIRISPNVQRKEISHIRERQYIREQLCSQLFDILYVYRTYILENIVGVQQTRHILREENRPRSYCDILTVIEQQSPPTTNVHIPTLGIIYHFLRNDLLDNTTGYFCWRKSKDTSITPPNHGLTVRDYMGKVSMEIEKLRCTIPLLDEYIVGIDAASDENAMEPWMFTPAYTNMRSQKISKPVVAYGYSRISYRTIQNIGFTYHVGEDFRHILSGLRHIDEVIERFFYKPGDRLGHAIALGIDIRKWVQENEVVAMPMQEHLENLLWMWGKVVLDNINVPIRLRNLEEYILEHANKLYRHSESITVKMLYDAYKNKFQANHMSMINDVYDTEPGQSTCQCAQASKDENKTFCYYGDTSCCLNSTSWNSTKLLSTNYCPVFEEQYRKIMLVSVPEAEIATYEYLQEYLLSKTEQKGIYVETNPTSNITISDIHSIYEHPIFRMSSLRDNNKNSHHILVTVNSDDPAVFNTNVENELAYIYHAAEHEGHPREHILKWIDNIRQNGLDSSFIRKEKDCYQLLREISTIMDELKNMGRNY